MGIAALPQPIHGTHDKVSGNVVAVSEETMLFIPDAGGEPALILLSEFRADRHAVTSVEEMVPRLLRAARRILEGPPQAAYAAPAVVPPEKWQKKRG